MTLSNATGGATLRTATTTVTFYQVRTPRPVPLYIPSNYDAQKPMPLVILLHGAGWSGQTVEDWMRFRPLAEARGFLYCYPDATIDSSRIGGALCAGSDSSRIRSSLE